MLDTPLMLWELSVIEQRYRAVLEVMAGVPVTEVAEWYGVSPRACVPGWAATGTRCRRPWKTAVTRSIPIRGRSRRNWSRRVLGPDRPDTLASRNNLADAYREAGRVG